MKTGYIIRLRMLTRITCASFLALLVIGCASIPERNPVPPESTNLAGISGVPDARFWGDEWPTFAIERFRALTDAQMHRSFPALYNRSHNYVAISGGGSNGAFGAGLFAGWTASGTRPEFAMVTGVSTGALTAPFVFLGSGYDDILKQIYTTMHTKDIAEKRNLIAAIFSDSMADSKPLRRLIEKYISADIIVAIAREHKRGKRLYIGTANLDAGRSVIWNVGAIAASDFPRKRMLIHDILLASASIPVAFPPVVIPVDVNGEFHDEMHVDGGTGAQVFVYPSQLNWHEISRKLKVKGKPKVYVIRNSFLEADYRGIKRSVIPIANRSIASLIRTQGIGDLYQIYALCKRDGNDFNLAYSPTSFTEEPSEDFDPVYMRKLYTLGYEMAEQGYPWEKGPPGFSDDPL